MTLLYKRPQQPLTVRAEVREEETGNLRRMLERIGDDPAGNSVIPFGRLGNIHFARLLILDATHDLDGRRIPPSLLLATDIDGDLKDHVRHLGEMEGLDQVFGLCHGYPERTDALLRSAFLENHRIKTATFYANTLGRTVSQIRREAELRERIEDFLDGRDWKGKSALEVRCDVQAFVENHPDLESAREAPAEFNGKLWGSIRRRLVRLNIAGFLDCVRRLLFFIPNNDQQEFDRPANEHVRRLTRIEDLLPQNQFSAVGFVKVGGFFRFGSLISQIVLRTILPLANYATYAVFNKGNLANVQSIHFARWVTLDHVGSVPFFSRARRACFFSSYDGSQENYMGEFIDKVAWGLNATFSRGVGYPKALFLVFDGAKNEQAFKSFIRSVQIPTQVWYSAYPRLTAANINNNEAIRRGLFAEMNEAEAQSWLYRF